MFKFWFLLELPGKNLFLCLLHVCHWLSSFLGSSSHITIPFIPWLPSSRGLFFSHFDSLTSPSYKNHEIRWGSSENPGQSPLLKTLNLITSEKSLLPCKITYSQVPGISKETFCEVWRGSFCLPQGVVWVKRNWVQGLIHSIMSVSFLSTFFFHQFPVTQWLPTERAHPPLLFSLLTC